LKAVAAFWMLSMKKWRNTMSEKMKLSLPKAIWDRYERLSKQRQQEATALMEKVLVTYLDNEETDEGMECNINFLGAGSLDPC
jgi:hypothetical protein